MFGAGMRSSMHVDKKRNKWCRFTTLTAEKEYFLNVTEQLKNKIFVS